MDMILYDTYIVVYIHICMHLCVYMYIYTARHKNCSPAVECRNHLSEITAHFKYNLGSCSGVSEALPWYFPWGQSLDTTAKEPAWCHLWEKVLMKALSPPTAAW